MPWQVCRTCIGTINPYDPDISLKTVENIVEANTALGVPVETQYIDIDYMERAMGFTIDEKFQGNVIQMSK